MLRRKALMKTLTDLDIDYRIGISQARRRLRSLPQQTISLPSKHRNPKHHHISWMHTIHRRSLDNRLLRQHRL
jgi:hypothetical protein